MREKDRKEREREVVRKANMSKFCLVCDLFTFP